MSKNPFFKQLGPLPPGIVSGTTVQFPLDFILCFAKTEARLLAQMEVCKAALTKTGMLWLAWPKRTASLSTDLSREVVRHLGLASGLVDVKVCAIDADWSALKFVYRLVDR